MPVIYAQHGYCPEMFVVVVGQREKAKAQASGSWQTENCSFGHGCRRQKGRGRTFGGIFSKKVGLKFTIRGTLERNIKKSLVNPTSVLDFRS